MPEDLKRCDREIAEMEGQHNAPAWLVMLGVEDWECEKRLLLAGRSQFDGSQTPTEAKP